MTLVQVLADEHSIHMACDFRLTDARTKRPIQDDAHKLVAAGRVGDVLIGVTGLAHLGGRPIARWIAETVGPLSGLYGVDDVADRLRNAAEPLLARVADAEVRRTSFVVSGAIGTQIRIALVSNFEAIVHGQIQRSNLATSRLTISGVKPKSPVYLATGVTGLVASVAQESVKTLLRCGASDETIQSTLAELNAAVSRFAVGVSEGCYAASRHVTGTGSAKLFPTEGQTGDFTPPETAEMLRSMGITIRPAIGPDGKSRPLRFVGSTSVTSGSGEKYFRGQLKLEPDNAELWNDYGADLASRRKLEAATEAFKRACDLDGSNPVAHANLAHRRWVDSKDAAEADGLYSRALQLWGEDVPAWALSNYADFRFDAFEDFDGALDLHRRASADARHPIAVARFGFHLLRSKGDAEEARALIDAAVAADQSNAEVLSLAGLAEVRYLGNQQGGRDHAERAASLAPHEQRILLRAGEICLLSGEGHSAAYYFRKAVDHGATGWEIQAAWGLALLLANKLHGALRHLNAARGGAPEHSVAVVEINIAATMWASGDYDGAIERLSQLLENSPNLEASWELELLAMLEVAGVKGRSERLQQLIEAGTTSDALSLRGMVVRGDGVVRELAAELASVICR